LAARSIVAEIVVIGVRFWIPCLPGRLEQCQLLFRQLLAFAIALCFQQFPQQALVFLLLGAGTIQLLSQIEHHLAQRVSVLRQTVRIDRHRAYSLPGDASTSKPKQK
jgi:hypothetical protein